MYTASISTDTSTSTHRRGRTVAMSVGVLALALCAPPANAAAGPDTIDRGAAAAALSYDLRVLPRPAGYGATSDISDVHVNDAGRAIVNLEGKQVHGCFVTGAGTTARWLSATAAHIGASSIVTDIACADMANDSSIIGTVTTLSTGTAAVVWSPAGLLRVLPHANGSTARVGHAVNDTHTRFLSGEELPDPSDPMVHTLVLTVSSASGGVLHKVTISNVSQEDYVGFDVANSGLVTGTHYGMRFSGAGYLSKGAFERFFVPVPSVMHHIWSSVGGASPSGAWIVGRADLLDDDLAPLANWVLRYRTTARAQRLAGTLFAPTAVNDAGTIVGTNVAAKPVVWRAGTTRTLTPLVRNLPIGWTLTAVTSINKTGVIGGVVKNAKGMELPMTLTPR